MTRFREAFQTAYYGEQHVTKSLVEAARAAVGVPQHEDLEVGETRQSTLACTFVDLRGFTKMALALPPRKTVRILQSVVVASNVHFAGFGGQVLDYSDGAMAVFERPSHTDAVWDAIKAVAFILSDIRTVVNEDLKLAEDHTVRAAAGLEFGTVLWTRLGDDATSQVKPISGVTFLAGKNSQSGHTDSWQALTGPGMSPFVPDQYKSRAETYAFQFNKKDYRFERWTLKWESYLTDYVRDEASVRNAFALRAPLVGGAVTDVGRIPDSPSRQLRDEPYA